MSRRALLLGTGLTLGLIPSQAPPCRADPVDTGAPSATDTAPRRTPAPPGPLVPVPAALLEPALTLPPELATALATRAWSTAAPLLVALRAEPPAADLAFLRAWVGIRTGNAAASVPLLDLVRQAPTPPPAYVALTVGEVLAANDEPVAASEVLCAVSEEEGAIWPRARIGCAEALRDAGRTADSRAVYEALVERSDPAQGNATALLALARRSGFGSDAAYPLLRRIWRAYPGTAEDEVAAKALASSYPRRGPDAGATLDDKAARADALMERNRYKDAIALLEPAVSGVTKPSEAACRAGYVLGRSRFKLNRLTDAIPVLRRVGEDCTAIDPDRGARALYIAGKALERRKQWGTAAQVFARIPALYPDHSMADDGYTFAGIGWQESGNPERALEAWATQVEAYPEGDLTAEAYWRLAWSTWLSGDTARAIAWADQAAERLDLETDPVHVLAAVYWRARWRAWPDPSDPARRVEDPSVLADVASRLTALCTEHPHHYYALLAAGRLGSLDPERLASLAPVPWGRDPAPWQVRASFLDAPPVRRGLALARLGLLAEARNEIDRFDGGDLTAGETGLLADLVEGTGQWLYAHDLLRRYLREHPPETLGPNRDRFLLEAYPDRFGDEIRTAVASHGFDALLFHALVREESNFNERIVSHAGARGLSQLMPATAQSVARKMGTTVTRAQLFEPEKNLPIGAWYLDFLLDRFERDPFLALAGYNAGEGAVDRWLAERGNRPVDAFVEAIPYRETREYVKRVSTTWQTYRLLEDASPRFPDLSAFTLEAVP
ncbi:MAG: transglycosylase SLT domain-containing protein [Deltaproteobacteria bacterium]|nr:transglycosylase SLT domain-containing protein [Deltaproteobacteria bacterium]